MIFLKKMSRTVLFLTIFSCLLTFPALQGNDSIDNGKKEVPIQHKLIELIDEVVTSRRYWENINAHYCMNLTTLPKLHNWLHGISPDLVQNHITALHTLEYEITTTLGLTTQPNNPFSTPSPVTLKKFAATLAEHKIPSHFKRNWVKYTGAALVSGIAAYQLHTFLKSNSVFEFDATNSTDYEKIHKLLTADKLYRFTQTTFNGKGILIGDTLNVAPAIRNIFASAHIPVSEHSQKISELPYHWYTINGETIFGEFLRNNLTTPLKNLWHIALKKPTTDRISASISVQNLKDKLYTRSLDLLETLHQNPGYTALTENYNVQDLTEWTPAQVTQKVQEIFNYKNAFIDSKKYAGNWIVSWLGKFFSAGRINTICEDPLIANGFTEINTLRAQLTYATSADIYTSIQPKIEVANELIDLVPSMIAGYYSATKIKNFFSARHYTTVIMPLTKDLHDFEYFLKNYHTTDNSTAYLNGIVLYWANRLKTYLPKIHVDQRIYFERTLATLTSTISPEQRLTIVSSILHYDIKQF